MENTNKVERSELWNDIYRIVKQIPRKEVDGDAVDAPSATTSIENLIEKYKIKSEKWDKLDEKIGKFYENDIDDEENEDGEDEGNLIDIGEVAAIAFGYLQPSRKLFANVSGLCVVALSKNLKLTTTLDRAITQNPCYVPYFVKL